MKSSTKLVFHRIKEEERRKELLKMRDEARAARLAELEVSLSSGPMLRSLAVVLTITIYRTEKHIRPTSRARESRALRGEAQRTQLAGLISESLGVSNQVSRSVWRGTEMKPALSFFVRNSCQEMGRKEIGCPFPANYLVNPSIYLPPAPIFLSLSR